MFDDFCRLAIGRLHDFRLEWVENLGDGYDVSDMLCSDINAHRTLPMQSLQELTFATTVKDALVKYTAGMKSVLSSSHGNFGYLNRHSGQHA